MVDDTMPDILASTPIAYVRILALEALTVLLKFAHKSLV